MTRHLIIAAALAFGMPSLALAQAAPKPVAVDWSKTVVATPGGGFQMGNPKAKVHILEFGSLTCPACRQFNAVEKPKLIAKYIKSGKVRFEFRSFLLHGAPDYMASLMTYCLPANKHFVWSDVVFNQVNEWTSGFSKITKEDENAAQALSQGGKAQEALVFLANKGGFGDFWRKQGVPKATYDRCMNNPDNFKKLATVYKEATGKYKVSGTPSFFVNEKAVPSALKFDDLDVEIKKIIK
jgi:protein-disulfide isomerase